LGAELDTVPFADLYAKLPPETRFTRALEALKNLNTPIEHPEWVFDEKKAAVLYTLMKKKAIEFPNEEIIFDFYDDRKDIIQSLINFYARYDYLRPPNVILRLHHYDSAEIKDDDFAATHNRVDGVLSSIPSEPSLLRKIQTAGLGAYSFFNYSKPAAEFPGAYVSIWDNPRSGLDKRKIKALLMDYTKESSLFGAFVGRMISGHWNRHHVDAVSKIIANISTRNYYESIDDIIDDLKALKPRRGGSLWRRIQFIEKKIEEQEVYNFNFT
jgi:hypothetical protein